jgi:hypothetical protein
MSLKTRLSKLESNRRASQSMVVFLRPGDDREAKLAEAYQRQGLKPGPDDPVLFITLKRLTDKQPEGRR